MPVEDPRYGKHPCTEDGESRPWPHPCCPALAFSCTCVAASHVSPQVESPGQGRP